jgi:DNA replication protein DnaC
MSMTCPYCDDTGWKTAEVEGVSRAVRCDCWRAGLTARLLKQANIPPRYQRCDLDNFRDYNDSLVEAVRRARRFVETFPVVDRGIGFLGPPGVGKTHLSVAILKLVIQRTGARGLFYTTSDLLSLIRNTYNPLVKTTEREAIEPLLQAEILVLDELGTERPTEWVEETMNLIVNTRYNERRITLFTSNYPDKESSSLVDTLTERIGFRMFSRLCEMCDFVEVHGVHFREISPDATPDEIAKLDSKAGKGPKDLSPKRRHLKAQLRSEERAGSSKDQLGWSGGRGGTG